LVSGPWLDVGVDADDHGQVVDLDVSGLVAAGDGERFAGRGASSGISMWRTLSLIVVSMMMSLLGVQFAEGMED
jgi:hypothetical protein